MTPSLKRLAGAVGLSWLAGQTLCAEAIRPSRETARERGPEIFNAIHDSMRQWGSSLHHNGMSAFLATIPSGTLLYHGNTASESPAEPDWLSFEIEHAELFARDYRPPRKGPDDPAEPPVHETAASGYQVPQQHLSSRGEDELVRGWLHVYQTTRPLHLLYIDGMGAAKSHIGSLDFQDFLLLDTRTADDPLSSERERADGLCALCGGWGLDGVVRMEAGFEVIKCDFAEGMEEVQALPRRAVAGPPPREGFWLREMEYIRGVGERYHGIGASRTVVDYSYMVSAYFFPVNLTNPHPERGYLPRLSNVSDEELAGMRAYLVETIKGRREQDAMGVDWQGVADLIVGRYADRIEYMATTINSTSIMAAEIDFLLDLFIDYAESNELSGAIPRCVNFYLRTISTTSEIDQLILDAFEAVTSRICTTLFQARDLVSKAPLSGDSQALAASKDILASLIDFLGWSRFMRGPACALDEALFIPMWPFGTEKDYGNPRCINISHVRGEGESHWGMG